MNSARKKSRDARRISDIANIKTALEMYYDANQSYPLTSAALYTVTTGLAPTYIPNVPYDPVGTNVAYAYAAQGCGAGPATPCTGYHLGAVLEDATNPALKGDADKTVATYTATAGTGAFEGTSAATVTCNATAGVAQGLANATEVCYDVTP